MTHAAFRCLAAALLLSVPEAARAQQAPRLAEMTTTRLLLLPAQEVSGTAEGRAWLARFDSVLTARLYDGGVANGWAYPRDAVRYSLQNPTYVSDPHLLGTQALKSEKAKPGVQVPEPFGSRLRALIAIANTRNAIVPISAVLDSTVIPRTARLQVAIVDGRLGSILSKWTVEAKYAGAPIFAADSLAYAFARFFVQTP